MKTSARTPHTRQMTSAVAIAIACGLLWVLPGCCIPKLQGPKPAEGPPPSFFLPDEYNSEHPCDNSAYDGVHEFFTDPQLTMLFEQAFFGNQELRILAQEIQIANNEIIRRRGILFPFVNLRAGASLDKLSTFTPEGQDLNEITTPVGGRFPNPLPDFLLAAEISWQIDIWRQLRNARDAQGRRFLGTIDGRNYVVTRVVAEIAENYYTLMALDNRLQVLDKTIALQQQSLQIAIARKEAARDTELAVQRFQAEVRKNQSEKLIIAQEIIETENRINFLCGRYPQPVVRNSKGFIDLHLHALRVGVPAQLLQNRPDIRKAERDLEAAGLEVRVARANFYPKLSITAGVGYEAFNTRYLFMTPESLIYNTTGNLIQPFINRSAIKADYLNANAEQLQKLYDYQRTVLNAFTEVVNRVSKVQNYTGSIVIKRQQLASLETAVAVSSNLFQNARVEYLDVLTSQRDRLDATNVLIDTKKEQLSAIVNSYQALGGGWQVRPVPIGVPIVEALPPAEVVPAPIPQLNQPQPQPQDPSKPLDQPKLIEPLKPIPQPK